MAVASSSHMTSLKMRQCRLYTYRTVAFGVCVCGGGGGGGGRWGGGEVGDSPPELLHVSADLISH